MKRIRTLVVMLLLATIAFAPIVRASSQTQIDVYIIRYLDAVNYAQAMKGGIQDELSRSGNKSPFLQNVLAMPNGEILKTVAPLFRSTLSLDEARALADFYRSDTGRSITQQQVADPNNPDPAIHLSKEQKIKYDQFLHSKAGDAELRVNALMRSLEYNKAVDQALTAMFQSQTP